MYTVAETAESIGIAPRTVRAWCKRLGYETTGRDYILTDEQVEEIRTRSYRKPGRPPKE